MAGDQHVEALGQLHSQERIPQRRALPLVREISVERAPVHQEIALAWPQVNAGHAALPSSGPVILLRWSLDRFVHLFPLALSSGSAPRPIFLFSLCPREAAPAFAPHAGACRRRRSGAFSPEPCPAGSSAA